jgi:type II secretory pathway pseudopilin PulG
MHTRRGFSISELLVILSVVAVLSTIVLGNLGEARAKARDRERIASLEQMQVVLRLYKEQYGRYPERGCPTVLPAAPWASPGPGDASWYAECDEYVSGVIPDLMSELPTDPTLEDNNNVGIMYSTNAQGTDYKLLYHGGAEAGIITKGEPYARCPASCSQSHCTQTSYAVYTDGAACW